MLSVSHAQSFFSTQVLRNRFLPVWAFSTTLSCVIGTLISKTIYAITFSSSWNPISISWETISSLFHMSWISCVFAPLMCNVVLLRIHAHSYSVSWWLPENRLEHIKRFVLWKSLFNFTFLTITCCYLFHHFASIASPSVTSIVQPCSSVGEGQCLNHECVLVIFFGILYGIRFSMSYCGGNLNYIAIPFVHPHNQVNVWLKMRVETIWNSFCLYGVGVWFITGVIVLFVLIGNNVCFFLSSILHLNSYDSLTRWQLVSQNVSIKLLIVIIGTYFILSYHFHCFFSLFTEFCCKPFPIPVSDSVTEPDQPSTSWTLSNTLLSNGNLLQVLSFKYLKESSEDLSSAGIAFRKEVFTISQPGGHPHNWNGIVNPSLNLIRKFTDRLRTALTTESTMEQNKPDIKGSSFLEVCSKRFMEAISSFKQYPIFCYLLSTLPDAKVRQTFADCQPVIYAVEALGSILAASFTEDYYGVVQRNFKDVLTALVELQLLVDKSTRSTYAKRSTQNIYLRKCDQMQELILRKRLRRTLRSSIYTVTNVFKNSVREVDFTPEVRTKIASYLSFQEG